MFIDIPQVKSYVQTNLDSVRKTQQVAAQMNCPLDRLKKTFYKIEKISLSKFIRESRVARMKEQLQGSDAPCKVICLDLGLREDVGARLFKNTTGMTMEGFRKMHRNGTREMWLLEARKQAESKPAAQIVLTEKVIRHVLSTSQSAGSRQNSRSGDGMLLHGRAN